MNFKAEACISRPMRRTWSSRLLCSAARTWCVGSAWRWPMRKPTPASAASGSPPTATTPTVSSVFASGGVLSNFFLINLFIYLWLRWVFVAACGLSLVVVSGDYSSLRCVGFSLQWFLLLRSTGSRRTGFSSCGTWAQ